MNQNLTDSQKARMDEIDTAGGWVPEGASDPDTIALIAAGRLAHGVTARGIGWILIGDDYDPFVGLR